MNKYRFFTFLLTIILICFSLLLPKPAQADLIDTFTAPNGTGLHIYNPIYTYYANNLPIYIQNNSITPNRTTVQINDSIFTDGCMSMDWTGNSTNTNMAIRYTETVINNTLHQKFYNFLQQNQAWLLRGYYENNYHLIASGSLDFSGTHNFKLCAIGSTISVYKDGLPFASGNDNGVTGGGVQLFYSEGNTLDNLNIAILDEVITPTPTTIPPLPRYKDECKKLGWVNYPIFKNQGNCVSTLQSSKSK